MKNLIKAIEKEQKKHLNEFIFSINNEKELKDLYKWKYNELLPKGKNISFFSFTELKSYLIKRKEKQIYKIIQINIEKIKEVKNSGELISVKISIEWKQNKTWGSNPTAEAWLNYKKDGFINTKYVNSGSIGGCGYDKRSTAVAQALNQFDEILKPLFILKNKNITKNNHEIFGYGSGYGILPSIEGGVGVSCYNKIFNSIGYEFKSVASGKIFDVYEITKL